MEIIASLAPFVPYAFMAVLGIMLVLVGISNVIKIMRNLAR